VEGRQAEVEEAGRDRLAVDEGMTFAQMPAARPHHQRRGLVPEGVRLLRQFERDRAARGVANVPLPFDDVRPRRRAGVLEVRHEDPRARVERVDHHLAVDGAGDLDAAVAQVHRRRRDAPGAASDVRRLGEEVRLCSRGELRHSFTPPGERLGAGVAELALETRDEGQPVRRENLVVGCAQELDASSCHA
jgi:hypothetical protein